MNVQTAKAKIGVRVPLPRVEHVKCPFDISKSTVLPWNMLFQVGIEWFFCNLKNLGNVFHENYSTYDTLIDTW